MNGGLSFYQLYLITLHISYVNYVHEILAKLNCDNPYPQLRLSIEDRKGYFLFYLGDFFAKNIKNNFFHQTLKIQ